MIFRITRSEGGGNFFLMPLHFLKLKSKNSGGGDYHGDRLEQGYRREIGAIESRK